MKEKESSIMSVSEAARKLNVTGQTVKNWIKSGILKGFVSRGRVWVRTATVNELLTTGDEVSRVRTELEKMKEEYFSLVGEYQSKISEVSNSLRITGKISGISFRQNFLDSVLLLMQSSENISSREITIIKELFGELCSVEDICNEYKITSNCIGQIMIRVGRKICQFGDKVQDIIKENEKLKLQQDLMEDELQQLRKKVKENIARDLYLPYPVIVSEKITETGFDFSVRTLNILKYSAEIKYVYQLCNMRKSDLLQYRNCGKKTLVELEDFMEWAGLSFESNFNVEYILNYLSNKDKE